MPPFDFLQFGEDTLLPWQITGRMPVLRGCLHSLVTSGGRWTGHMPYMESPHTWCIRLTAQLSSSPFPCSCAVHSLPKSPSMRGDHQVRWPPSSSGSRRRHTLTRLSDRSSGGVPGIRNRLLVSGPGPGNSLDRNARPGAPQGGSSFTRARHLHRRWIPPCPPLYPVPALLPHGRSKRGGQHPFYLSVGP